MPSLSMLECRHMMPIIVVGAGIFGCVVAERVASVLNQRVLVLEKRSVVGGNSYAEFDSETGIECHRYGSHIFHTKNEEVWNYIRAFTDFTPYRHKVLLKSEGREYPMPISLPTIRRRFGRYFSPDEARAFVASQIAEAGIQAPANLEEKAISLVGRDLYGTLIRGYTAKQWGRDPRTLPESIIARLPIRYDDNTDYFDTPMQGIPTEGFSAMFNRLLSHPNIKVRTGTDYFDVRDMLPQDSIVVYTGMIDRLFDFKFGPLEWRSLRFEWETLPIRDFQGTTVVNYGDEDVPFTRIHEFKHYNPERTGPYRLGKTVICREYPKAWTPDDEAYYPVNDAANATKLALYRAELDKHPNLYAGGRLGAYAYWDMDRAIAEALALFETLVGRMNR